MVNRIGLHLCFRKKAFPRGPSAAIGPPLKIDLILRKPSFIAPILRL
jgi:hypothetical protein